MGPTGRAGLAGQTSVGLVLLMGSTADRTVDQAIEVKMTVTIEAEIVAWKTAHAVSVARILVGSKHHNCVNGLDRYHDED